ncbi:MAG: hypothetical protein IKZ37_01435 [Bacteroidaceae bacterium]|nr:hypothetical protein [Bacteroidaceae bacterium]
MSREDDILQRLQRERVTIVDNEAFTDFIMSAIPEKKPVRKPLWLPVARLLYAAAVVAAVYCLLPAGVAQDTASYSENRNIMAQYGNGFSSIDKNGTPGEILRCYVEQRKANVSIIKHLKSQTYENLR